MFYTNSKTKKPTITIHIVPVPVEIPNYPHQASAPYRLGFKAGFDGRKLKDCPYSFGQKARAVWLKGLVAGKYQWTSNNL